MLRKLTFLTLLLAGCIDQHGLQAMHTNQALQQQDNITADKLWQITLLVLPVCTAVYRAYQARQEWQATSRKISPGCRCCYCQKVSPAPSQVDHIFTQAFVGTLQGVALGMAIMLGNELRRACPEMNLRMSFNWNPEKGLAGIGFKTGEEL